MPDLMVDLSALAADLEMLDDRIQVEIIPAWSATGCDLCMLLECPGDARVSWWHGQTYSEVAVNVSHLPGWISGFVVPDSADERIQIELGRAA